MGCVVPLLRSFNNGKDSVPNNSPLGNADVNGNVRSASDVPETERNRNESAGGGAGAGGRLVDDMMG